MIHSLAELSRPLFSLTVLHAQQGHSSVSDDGGVGGKDAESAASLRLLLTRWREKVFVMLVQQKLSQIHDSRIRHEAQRKVHTQQLFRVVLLNADVAGLHTQEAELKEELQRIEREKELLNHSLADRNAELQLQINKTSVSRTHSFSATAVLVFYHPSPVPLYPPLLYTCTHTHTHTHTTAGRTEAERES